MWREENTQENINNPSAGVEMRGAGVTPGGMQGDLDNLGDATPDADSPPPADEGGDTEPGGAGGGGATPPADTGGL